ncbi:MAG: AMIN domain-containing protein, partial [Gammaproteobacteria bacterium]|nr:AMIN domain-containing protein [Gammaproteobacteria bacterium]
MCAALSGVCSIHGASAAEVRTLALSTGPGGAQLTLDLRGVARTHVFKLAHPDRVVIDLTGTHLANGVRAPPPGGVVSGIRLGRQPHGTLRVVVQLESPLPARTRYGHDAFGRQLVVTLGEPALAGAAGGVTAIEEVGPATGRVAPPAAPVAQARGQPAGTVVPPAGAGVPTTGAVAPPTGAAGPTAARVSQAAGRVTPTAAAVPPTPAAAVSAAAP